MGSKITKDALRLKAEEKLEMLIRKNLIQHLGEFDDKELLHELQVHMVELLMQKEELKNAHNTVDLAYDRYRTLFDYAPFCYFTIDKSGIILEANQTAAFFLNVTKDKLIGRYLQSFLDRESADSLHLFMKKEIPRGRTESLAYKLQPSEGPAINVSLRINAEYDDSDRIMRYRVVLVDMKGFIPENK